MKPVAFISSLSTEHSNLRETLFRDFGEAVWVAEYSANCLAGKDDLEIVDTCTDFIEQAPHFICVFAGRRGTRIRVGNHLANATHFETELFHAALLRKCVHVFVANGFESDPSLRGILEVLEASVDANQWHQQLTDDQIRTGIDKILNARFIYARRHILRRLADSFFESRRGKIRSDTPLTEFFAGDSLANERMIPNIDLINSVLKSLESGQHQRKQLSRIYIALREVLARPLSDTEFLASRNQLLAVWTKTAAWYGLHAHVRSGVLAAAQSMALVRQRLRTASTTYNDDENLHYPGGALASALYSISKNLPRMKKAQALQEALAHLNQSLAEPEKKQDNLLAIRGSVFRQLGMLDEAVKDYECVLKIRERLGVQPSKIGEAMTELGFGYFRQGKLGKALDYMEQGVELIREEPNSGFLLRAMRKLVIVSAANLRFQQAWRIRKEQRLLAIKSGMYDQL